MELTDFQKVLLVVTLIALIAIMYYHSQIWAEIKKMSGMDKSAEHFAFEPTAERAAFHRWLAAERAGRASASCSATCAADPSLSGLTPEQLAEAEQSAWSVSQTERSAPVYNTENAGDQAAETSHQHSSTPAIDYDTYLESSVVDARTRENHRAWVDGMQNFTGRMRTVDNMEEAVEASIGFQGLRRPQAVHQSKDALHVTEVDAGHFTGNSKFNFRC